MSGVEVVISAQSRRDRSAVRLGDVGRHRRVAAKQGFEIDKRKIGLREPIKKLGEQTVPVKLHREVVVQVPVRVVAEGKPEVAPAELKAQTPAQPRGLGIEA